MNIFKNTINIVAALSVCAALFLFISHEVTGQWFSQSFAGGAGQMASSCTVATSTVTQVGFQVSRTILAAKTTRAWASIEQPINATNTVSLAFNAGTAATLTSGYQLTAATSTNPVTSIFFGRNTDFPYTGEVTGITNVSSTTLLITECNY